MSIGRRTAIICSSRSYGRKIAQRVFKHGGEGLAASILADGDIVGSHAMYGATIGMPLRASVPTCFVEVEGLAITETYSSPASSSSGPKTARMSVVR